MIDVVASSLSWLLLWIAAGKFIQMEIYSVNHSLFSLCCTLLSLHQQTEAHHAAASATQQNKGTPSPVPPAPAAPRRPQRHRNTPDTTTQHVALVVLPGRGTLVVRAGLDEDPREQNNAARVEKRRRAENRERQG